MPDYFTCQWRVEPSGVIGLISSLQYSHWLYGPVGRALALRSWVQDGHAVLEITVGHRTLSDQILKMSGQFHIMIGHDDRTCHQHILSSLLQGVVSQ